MGRTWLINMMFFMKKVHNIHTCMLINAKLGVIGLCFKSHHYALHKIMLKVNGHICCMEEVNE